MTAPASQYLSTTHFTKGCLRYLSTTLFFVLPPKRKNRPATTAIFLLSSVFASHCKVLLMKKTTTLLFAFFFIISIAEAQPDSARTGLSFQPLGLRNFSAQVIDNSIQLTWTATANEEAKNFEIERAEGGLSFQKIGGRLAGAQQGAAPYEFVDALPKKNILFSYRIRVNGKDGSSSYSELRAVKIDAETLHCRLKRNPVGQSVEVEVTSTSAQQLQATVVTGQGQKLATETARLSAGTNSLSFPLQNLQPGLHRLVLEAGSERKVISFVKE